MIVISCIYVGLVLDVKDIVVIRQLSSYCIYHFSECSFTPLCFSLENNRLVDVQSFGISSYIPCLLYTSDAADE